MLPCRLLPHEVRSGPANMALDQALLDSVDADPSAAVLRTYGWSEPTLSLGYFQPVAEVGADLRWAGRPLVRRPSGGGALWHHHEVTYALVVPRHHPLASRPSDLYRAVHAAIARALASRGIAAERRGESAGRGPGGRPFLCFLDRDPEDILCAGAKVVGSAQRRRPRAVLQHGAVLLAGSATTPELPGLADLCGGDAAPCPWAELLRARLPGELGLDPRPDDPGPAERVAAEALERGVYRDPTWTGRR